MEGITPVPPGGRAFLQPRYLPLSEQDCDITQIPNLFDMTENFVDMLGAKGFDIASGSRIKFSQQQASRFAAIAQYWLFGTTLASFLQTHLEYSDFCDKGLITLHGTKVNELFNEWHRRTTRLLLPELLKKLALCTTVLERVGDVLDRVDQLAVDKLENVDEYAVVSLSIRLLLVLLDRMRQVSFSSVGPRWYFSLIAPKVLPKFLSRVLQRGLLDVWPYEFSGQIRNRWWRPWFIKISSQEKEFSLHLEAGYIRLVTKHKPLMPGETSARPATKLLLGYLSDAGWCPMEARRMCFQYDYFTVNYLTYVQKDLTNVDHFYCVESGRCVAHNVNMQQKKYQYKHSRSCDRECHMISTPYAKLASIIENGKIPILCLERRILEPPILDVVEYNGRSPYVTLSHVWHDGLGNPACNAVSQCQLNEIFAIGQDLDRGRGFFKELLRDLWRSKDLGRKSGHGLRADDSSSSNPLYAPSIIRNGKFYFWLDTLCIPRASFASVGDDEQARNLRSKAIRMIPIIFSGSRATIVLGVELGQCVASTNTADLSAHIVASKHLQRAWTFEEALLSRRVLYSIHGKLFEIQNRDTIESFPLACDILNWTMQVLRGDLPIHIFNSYLLHSAPNPLNGKFSTVNWIKRTQSLQRLRLPDYTRVTTFETFRDVWNELSRRTTTNIGDSFIILANSLDYETRTLLCLYVNERLPAFLRSFPGFPVSLLYNQIWPLQEHSRPNARDIWIPTRIEGLIYNSLAPLLKPCCAQDCVHGYTPFHLHILWYVGLSPQAFFEASTPIPLVSTFLVILDSPSSWNSGEDECSHFIVETAMLSDTAEDSRPSSYCGEHGKKLQGFFLLDATYGTNSVMGHRGKGVQLSVLEMETAEHSAFFLTPLRPMTFWTPQQWNRQGRQDPNLLPSVFVRKIYRGRNPVDFILECDSDQWPGPVRKRPSRIFPQHTVYYRLGFCVFLILIALDITWLARSFHQRTRSTPLALLVVIISCLLMWNSGIAMYGRLARARAWRAGFEGS